MTSTGSALLDTSVVVAHLRGDAQLAPRLAELSTLFLPWVVLGELHYGAHRAQRRAEVLTQIQEFSRIAVLLLPSGDTAAHYGQIKSELAPRGTPIPDNDIWIAALALEYSLPLATRDQHFAAVPGLKTLAW
ncbi:MAG: type II toxin-antitoxin system VapC family toxin [Acidobacteria bacterium]|nr:type II toxin-antitoxin system VapC family toxin [Acidobacteriota bacterium]